MMERNVLVLTKEQYGDILNPLIRNYLDARAKAYNPYKDPNESHYQDYIKSRDIMHQKRKEVLNSHNIPDDIFVECYPNFKQGIYTLIWWTELK